MDYQVNIVLDELVQPSRGRAVLKGVWKAKSKISRRSNVVWGHLLFIESSPTLNYVRLSIDAYPVINYKNQNKTPFCYA